MEPKTSKSRRRPVLVMLGIALVLLFSASLVIYPKARQLWTEPLGPGLGLPTYTVASAAANAAANAAAIAKTTSASQPNGAANLFQGVKTAAATTVSLITTQTDTPTATTQPTATPEPLCGGPAVMTILGVGADNRDNTYLYGLGDVIKIARVDFVTPKVTVLSLPRDLWVEIPGISDHYGITHGKLNQSYLYGGPGMGYYDGPGAGPGLMARTLDLNFGLRVEHYGAVNMQTFVKIVDAVGGLDIYLPTDVDGTPIDDKTEDMGYFTAGQHHFNGSEALRFARIRKRYNDLTRMDNQNMVLCSLRAKVLTPSVLPKLPQIISAFQGSVLTDLSPQQIGQLACLFPQVQKENLIFTSLPQELLEPGRVYSQVQKNNTFILEVDNQVIRDYVSRFMAGDWPTQPDEPSCP